MSDYLTVSLLIIYSQVTVAAAAPDADACHAVHTRSSGLEIICCSRSQKLPDNCGHSVSAMCRSQCRCELFVAASQLRCIPEEDSTEIGSAPLWLDHKNNDNELFQCLNPTFPNTNSAVFHLNLDFDKNSAQIRELIDSFNASVNLQRFTVDLHDKKSALKILRMSNRFPNLEYLTIKGRQKYILNEQASMDGLSTMKHLKSIVFERIHNGSFGDLFSAPLVNFESSLIDLTMIHVKSVKSVPFWLEHCHNLETLTVTGSVISEISSITSLISLKRLNLSKNQITGHLSGILQSGMIKTVDLSGNSISSVSSDYFSKLDALELLDLSENPLSQLSEYSFRSLANLKWLYLKRTSIQLVSASHLVGLINLKVLNLQGCTDLYLDVYSLISTPNLETLDLRSMNLTVIPAAVTQSQSLKHLDLNFNLLHSNYSFPPEIMLNLPENLETLHFSENPLSEMPESFFGISISKRTKLLQNILVQLKMTELWWRRVCTEQIWKFHLRKYPEIIDSLLINSSISSASVFDVNHKDKDCYLQYQSIVNRLSIFNQYSVRLSHNRRSLADELEFDEFNQTPSDNLDKYAWFLPISLIFNVISFFIWLIILAVLVTHQLMRTQRDQLSQSHARENTEKYDLEPEPTFEELLNDDLNNNTQTSYLRAHPCRASSRYSQSAMRKHTTIPLKMESEISEELSVPSSMSIQEYA